MGTAPEVSFPELVKETKDTFKAGPQIYESSRRRDPRIFGRGWAFVAHASTRSRRKAGHGNDLHSLEPAIEIIQAGRHPLELLCTHRFPLEAAHDAVRAAGDRTDPGAAHVGILPNGEAP
jgi:hypothetical protein